MERYEKFIKQWHEEEKLAMEGWNFAHINDRCHILRERKSIAMLDVSLHELLAVEHLRRILRAALANEHVQVLEVVLYNHVVERIALLNVGNKPF